MTSRHIVAAVVFGAGVVVLGRALWRSVPARDGAPRVAAEAAGRVDGAPRGEALPQWEFDTIELEVLDPAAQPGFFGLFESTVLRAATDAGAGTDARAVAQEATAYFREVVWGSVESYARYVAERGGTTEVSGAESGTDESARRYIEGVLAAFREQPTSVERVQVRPRVRGGRTLPVKDFGGRSKLATSPLQYPALKNVIENTEYGTTIRGDTFEVLVPVRHAYDGASPTTVLIGLWLTRSPTDGLWRPAAVAMYGPPSLVPMVGPPM